MRNWYSRCASRSRSRVPVIEIEQVGDLVELPLCHLERIETLRRHL